MTGSMEVHRAGRVATVRFTRPDIGNAVTPDQATELVEALEGLTSDSQTRVVVITGSGSSFNVGAYRAPSSDAVSAPADEDRVARYERLVPTMRRAFDLIRSPEVVVVGAINGACAGAGFCLALACDLRYASTSAGFNTAFLQAGLSGELGAPWLATRLVGLARAKELFLLPRRRSAEQMLAMGLLCDVLPPAEMEAAVAEVSRTLAGFDPVALKGMKANLDGAIDQSQDAYLPVEHGRMVDCLRR